VRGILAPLDSLLDVDRQMAADFVVEIALVRSDGTLLTLG
jgi:hypothetical protein